MSLRLCSGLAIVAALVPAGSVAAPTAAEPVGLSTLGQVFGALALVLVLIFGLAIAVQRMKLGRGASGKHLRIVDALALGTRVRLLLVDVAGERVLLGLAGGRIERLHVLEAQVSTDFTAALDAALDPRAETP